jgi:hypothetical protein
LVRERDASSIVERHHDDRNAAADSICLSRAKGRLYGLFVYVQRRQPSLEEPLQNGPRALDILGQPEAIVKVDPMPDHVQPSQHPMRCADMHSNQHDAPCRSYSRLRYIQQQTLVTRAIGVDIQRNQ